LAYDPFWLVAEKQLTARENTQLSFRPQAWPKPKEPELAGSATIGTIAEDFENILVRSTLVSGLTTLFAAILAC
jgi:hypothetical protein